MSTDAELAATPVRRCLPVSQWPAADRAAWQRALEPGDILDPGGPAGEWSPALRRRVEHGYGRWLTFLASQGLLAAGAAPHQRPSRDRVRTYIDELKAVNAPLTVVGRIEGLAYALRAMAPQDDWAWLRDFAARLRTRARAADKQGRLRPIGDLFRLGLQLMADAEAVDDTVLRRAVGYRTGLMIALLSARPLRRRNFAGILLHRNLVQHPGGGWWLRFGRDETKAREPIEAALPETLGPALERYLAHWRPILLASAQRYRPGQPQPAEPAALWISREGAPMLPHAVTVAIAKATRAAFGVAIRPHLFRSCAATSIAIEDPVHVRMIKPVLQHRSALTGQRHYNQARTLEAGRRYADSIRTLLSGAATDD